MIFVMFLSWCNDYDDDFDGDVDDDGDGDDDDDDDDGDVELFSSKLWTLVFGLATRRYTPKFIWYDNNDGDDNDDDGDDNKIDHENDNVENMIMTIDYMFIFFFSFSQYSFICIQHCVVLKSNFALSFCIGLF